MLEPVLIGLISAGVAAAIGISSRAIARDKIRITLKRAAQGLGLELYPRKFLKHDGLLDGLLDGHQVKVTMTRQKGKTITWVAVQGADPAITLRRETVGLKVGMTVERWLAGGSENPWERAGDILIGDDSFDRRIDMRGPIPFCVAALDQPGREAVIAVVGALHGTVQGGEVSVETAQDLTGRRRLEGLIRSVHSVATLLRPRSPDAIRHRLINNYHKEENPKVRRTILAALGMGFSGHPDTLRVSREAVKDTAYNWIPVQAASNLGPEGIPVLQRILADGRRRESIHAACVRYLGLLLPQEPAEILLLKHLAGRRSAVALAAAKVLGEGVGTARSVPLLKETADHHASSDVRKAAQKALDAIAVKLEGVEPGGLTMAPAGEDGRLSVSQEPDTPPHQSREENHSP